MTLARQLVLQLAGRVSVCICPSCSVRARARDEMGQERAKIGAAAITAEHES